MQNLIPKFQISAIFRIQISGKSLHHVNSAPSGSTTEVTLLRCVVVCIRLDSTFRVYATHAVLI